MAKLKRTSIFKKRQTVDHRLSELSVATLRHEFMPLFDAGAQAIQVLGYEQDDGVIIRRLVCRVAEGREWVVEAEFLADSDGFSQRLTDALSKETGTQLVISDVTIVALEVETFLERWEES